MTHATMPIQDRIKPAVVSIARVLGGAGYETHLVGGAVRDLLLDLEPKDYDLATAAPPEQIRNTLGRRRCRIIGRRFRLVHVYAGGDCFEVSTFRREPSPAERCGREDDDGVMIWRDNVYGTLEQDARRRDFTVNALYYDPVGDRGIVDLVGGRADLEARLVRAIGEPALRLREDPVRMLRAVKLAGQYGFRLEPELDACLRRMVPDLGRASDARLFEELLKILGAPYACPILASCREFGLLNSLWPELDRLWDTRRGEFWRALVQERDTRVRAGGYSTSKSLALATACLPSVLAALNPGAAPAALWDPQPNLEQRCRQAVRGFYAPFPLSRYFSARVRDIILLLPRFRNGGHKAAVCRHPEYKYGRALFAALSHVCGWPEAGVRAWPPPPETERRSRRSQRPRGRGRRRRFDREQDKK